MGISAEKVVNEFVIDIIESAMAKFGLTYDMLEDILVRTGYMEMFNDTELMLLGAHHGMEPVMQKIREELG